MQDSRFFSVAARTPARKRFSLGFFSRCARSFRIFFSSSLRVTLNGFAHCARNWKSHSLGVVVRSEVPAARSDCLLIDTTGELRDWYAIATVVFIGKSLTAHGGQNPVEPIVAGKPVIFGPYMENFSGLTQSLVRHTGAIQVNDAGVLAARTRAPATRW